MILRVKVHTPLCLRISDQEIKGQSQDQAINNAFNRPFAMRVRAGEKTNTVINTNWKG